MLKYGGSGGNWTLDLRVKSFSLAPSLPAFRLARCSTWLSLPVSISMLDLRTQEPASRAYTTVFLITLSFRSLSILANAHWRLRLLRSLSFPRKLWCFLSVESQLPDRQKHIWSQGVLTCDNSLVQVRDDRTLPRMALWSLFLSQTLTYPSALATICRNSDHIFLSFITKLGILTGGNSLSPYRLGLHLMQGPAALPFKIGLTGWELHRLLR